MNETLCLLDFLENVRQLLAAASALFNFSNLLQISRQTAVIPDRGMPDNEFNSVSLDFSSSNLTPRGESPCVFLYLRVLLPLAKRSLSKSPVRNHPPSSLMRSLNACQTNERLPTPCGPERKMHSLVCGAWQSSVDSYSLLILAMSTLTIFNNLEKSLLSYVRMKC